MQAPDPRHIEHAHTLSAYFTSGGGGTGTASLLPMTEEEMAKVKHRPIGFAPPSPPKRTRKKPTA